MFYFWDSLSTVYKDGFLFMIGNVFMDSNVFMDRNVFTDEFIDVIKKEFTGSGYSFPKYNEGHCKISIAIV